MRSSRHPNARFPMQVREDLLCVPFVRTNTEFVGE